jgi:hypothetical protein
MEADPTERASRASSFANSFFKAGGDASVLDILAAQSDLLNIEEGGEGHDEDILPDNVVVPRARAMGRRVSTRSMAGTNRMSSRQLLQMHRNNNNSLNDNRLPEAPVMQGGVPTPTRKLSTDSIESLGPAFTKSITLASLSSPLQDRARPTMSRQPSWYRDLVASGMSAADLKAIAGDADFAQDSDGQDVAGGEPANDDLLAEQHRYLALIEAKKRVQARLGYDPEERRQQSKQAPPSSGHSRPCPLPTLNPPRWAPSRSFPYSVPSVEVPLDSAPFIRQRVPRQPELQKGQVFDGKTVGAGQMMVRCLGCKKNLRVSMQATLVICEYCSIVCPATSTRK